jgi:hypothetical protein
MTMESRQPEETGSNADLVRSAALSSADLWHEILERLNEVQEGQLRLARAIESLGLIVCDALSVNPHAALSGGEPTSMARTAPRVQLAAGPPTQPTFTSDPAATQRAIDSPVTSSPRHRPLPRYRRHRTYTRHLTYTRHRTSPPPRPQGRSVRRVFTSHPSPKRVARSRASRSPADRGPEAAALLEGSAAKRRTCPGPPSYPTSHRLPSTPSWPLNSAMRPPVRVRPREWCTPPKRAHF